MPIVFMAGLVKTNEELLSRIIEAYESRERGRTGYYQSYLLGLIAQNSEQASKATKKAAVRIAVDGQTSAFLRLEQTAVRFFGPIGRFAVIAGLERWIYYAVGSPSRTLKKDVAPAVRWVD